MADDDSNKTEQATPKRKEEARAQGQVVMSRDLSNAAVLLGGVGLLAAVMPLAMAKMTDVTRHGLTLTFNGAFRNGMTIESVHTVIMQTAVTIILLILPVVAGIALFGTGVS